MTPIETLISASTLHTDNTAQLNDNYSLSNMASITASELPYIAARLTFFLVGVFAPIIAYNTL